tara:strand:- start:1243 stop:2319 length:1077 start_codon:yes stop_codon:yes gene_type:complete
MKWTTQKKIFSILLIMIVLMGGLNVAKARGLLIPPQAQFNVYNNVVKLSTMSMEQKIAQMVVVLGLRDNYIPWRNMQLGGFYLYALPTKHVFNNTIIDFQIDMPIEFFVSADLEGCLSPFAHIQNFTANSDIETTGEAFEKGQAEGKFLNELGFNLNFAPVVDLDDTIWNCRSFPGDEIQIGELAQAYTLGLQNEGVLATIKHYPGKTLVGKDPHKFIASSDIEKADLIPYEHMMEKGDVEAIMVSHIITTGEIDSEGIPSVVNKKVIDTLKKDFDGLIISDEIHMLGLKDYYDSIDDMYVAVFKAGNDIVLNFDHDPNEIHRMILVVKNAVERGEIPRKQIDASVTKILEAKGYVVK